MAQQMRMAMLNFILIFELKISNGTRKRIGEMEGEKLVAEDGRRMNVPVDILPVPFYTYPSSLLLLVGMSIYTGGFFFSFFLFELVSCGPSKMAGRLFSLLDFFFGGQTSEKSTGGGLVKKRKKRSSRFRWLV